MVNCAISSGNQLLCGHEYSCCRYIEIFKSSRNEIKAYYEVPRRGLGGQRPGPYDRPVMAGPRGGFFGPSPGRGGSLMDNIRGGGGGYGGGIICVGCSHCITSSILYFWEKNIFYCP